MNPFKFNQVYFIQAHVGENKLCVTVTLQSTCSCIFVWMNKSVSSKASGLLQDWRGSWGARAGCWCCRCRLRGRRRGWLGSVRAGRARGGHRPAWLAATHTAGSRRCCRCCCCSHPEAGEKGDRKRKNGTLIFFFFLMTLLSSFFHQTQQHNWGVDTSTKKHKKTPNVFLQLCTHSHQVCGTFTSPAL